MHLRLLVVCLLLPLAGCTEDESEPEPRTEPMTHEVRIEEFAMHPKTLDVQVGDTVRWTNLDAATHTVTEEAYAFESGDLLGGETFAFTFDAAGTFGYRCDYHPSMTGWIVVT